MAILVTGGAGFIGSHTCVELLNAGEDIVVMDNFYNSNSRALDGIRKITGKDFKFYEDDMLDIAAVDQIFAENDIELQVRSRERTEAADVLFQQPARYVQHS